MAERKLPEMSPWRRHALTIPPDSWRAWVRLAVWEFWMGVLVYGALRFGTQLIVAAPENFVTVFDFTNCYGAPSVVQPCERVAYRAGALNVMLNAWCGLLLIAFAAWLLWELWGAVAPKPITDDFLKLLDDSFGRDWRNPRTWPWARMGWAYGFSLVGVTSAVGIGLLISAMISSSTRAKAPTSHVETSQSFRLVHSRRPAFATRRFLEQVAKARRPTAGLDVQARAFPYSASRRLQAFSACGSL